MARDLLKRSRARAFVAATLFLMFILACGASATATPQPTVAAVPTTAPAATAAAATAVPQAQPTAAAAAPWVGIAPGGKRGGVVAAYAVGNPGVWDPHRSPSGASMEHISKLYNQVMQYNPIKPGEIIGDLAESWEATDGGNTWTFRIHDGIRWWDGTALTAEDLAFSINRMIEPDEPRPRSGIIRTYVETAESIDPTTVKVSLKFPAAAFFSYMASDYMKIVPKHIIEAGIEIYNFDNIVGSGPFRATEFKQGDVVRFVRNDDYFKTGLPYFDGIDAFIIVDNSRAIAAFLAGQVLLCTFPYCDFIQEEFDTLAEKGGDFLEIFPEDASIIGWANLNVQHAPLDDPRVRRAIYLAIVVPSQRTDVSGRRPGSLQRAARWAAPFLPSGSCLSFLSRRAAKLAGTASVFDSPLFA